MTTIDFKKVMGFIIDDDNSNLNNEVYSPLIGLFSTFKELKTLEYNKVLILPCDIPLVKYEVLEFLLTQCKEYDCCIPKWNNNLLEPLIAIYPVQRAFETSSKNLTEKQYKLTKIISQNWQTNYISIEQEIKKIDPNLLSFKNINQRDDLNMLESCMKKK